MKHNYQFRPVAALIALSITASLMLIAGCHSIGGNDTDPTDAFTVRGAIVQDMNLDTTIVAVSFLANDTVVTVGTVSLGSYPLTFVGSSYVRGFDTVDVFSGATTLLQLTGAGNFADSVSHAVVDSLELTIPGNHIIQNNGNLPIEWSGAANATAYVMAAVKATEAYTSKGYSIGSNSGVTADIIIPDAFIIPGTNDADTGLFNIYVYAISGSPDLDQANAFLPVPLPTQLLDNIDLHQLTGTIGSVMVSLYDTVRVVQ